MLAGFMTYPAKEKCGIWRVLRAVSRSDTRSPWKTRLARCGRDQAAALLGFRSPWTRARGDRTYVRVSKQDQTNTMFGLSGGVFSSTRKLICFP